MATLDKIIELTKSLYPKGRAFKIPFGGYLDSLNKALSQSESRAFDDSLSILDSILPDNNNFDVNDALYWERRLGLITNESLTLEQRKDAISRKYNFPGNVNARQSYLWLQNQLQLAGFDVYVHENPLGQSPEELYVGSFTEFNEHGTFDHGEESHGGYYNNICANHVDIERDKYFEIGESYRNSFYIGGLNIGDFANIEASRELEFRQIILITKPLRTVGFLMVNYV